MVSVTVFRHVPRPITGMVGVIYDPAFEALEERLDWLETTGALVERFDPSAATAEVAARPAAREMLSAEGDRCLPLVLVNDAVVLRGGIPSRSQLARAVGRGRYEIVPEVARQLAAIGAAAAPGRDDELRRQSERARQMGIPEATIRIAAETGAGMRLDEELLEA